MTTWLKNSTYNLYLKIAEPRVIRLMQFGIYLCMVVSGFAVLAHPPTTFESVLGIVLVYVFGGFIFLGALLGLVTVLPGIWWLERVGLLCLITGLSIYSVAIVSLGSSPMGIIVAVAFGLTFAQRWMEIRKYQLAPLKE